MFILSYYVTKHSFILESVLPSLPESESRDFILMKGMELGLIPVLRHFVVLDCELMQGIVGVQPKLPLDEVVMVLGNELAGSVVQANVPPPHVVVSQMVAYKEPDESILGFPGVLPACAVMHAQSPNVSAPVRLVLKCKEDGVLVKHLFSLPDLPSPVSRKDWVESQRANLSLSALWDEALPVDKIRNVAQCYFV